MELPFDRLKNQRRAYVFITFSDEASADEACKQPKQKLGERDVSGLAVSWVVIIGERALWFECCLIYIIVEGGMLVGVGIYVVGRVER